MTDQETGAGEHPAGDTADQAHPPDAPPTVLIVEDDRPLATAFADSLEPAYEVRVAHSGEAGLERLDETVDAVLLDRRMPGLTGAETLARIRERGFDTPVAMVTAVDPDWDVIEMGFDDYLTKPVAPVAIVRAVERLCALGAVDDSARAHIARSITQAAIEGEKELQDLEESEAFAELVDHVAAEAHELGDATADLSPRETELVVESITRSLGRAESADRDDGIEEVGDW
jgi:DNA-binding response OmpR family regulator